jgi:hypothetical protein
MGLDRVVRYDKPLPKKVVEQVVRDYFGGLPKDLHWEDDRWYVDLPGPTSAALRSVHPGLPPDEGRPRWIEVWRDSKTIYVMTRDMDEATNALAEGLADVLMRTGRLLDKGGERDD